jgi:ribonucleotide monophosphatase NagD (HAD superfamily)
VADGHGRRAGARGGGDPRRGSLLERLRELALPFLVLTNDSTYTSDPPDRGGCVSSGLEAGMETMLGLTGVTTREAAERYPFRASRIVNSIGDLLETLG